MCTRLRTYFQETDWKSLNHPVKKYTSGYLLILENHFGSVIGGSHPDLNENVERVIKEAHSLYANVKIDDFYRIEQLGVEVSPKCGSCRGGKSSQEEAACL